MDAADDGRASDGAESDDDHCGRRGLREPMVQVRGLASLRVGVAFRLPPHAQGITGTRRDTCVRNVVFVAMSYNAKKTSDAVCWCPLVLATTSAWQHQHMASQLFSHGNSWPQGQQCEKRCDALFP